MSYAVVKVNGVAHTVRQIRWQRRLSVCVLLIADG